MTRVVVPRGPAGPSSNQNRSSLPGSSSAPGSQLFAPQIPSTSKEEEHEKEVKDPCALDDLPECRGSHDEKTMGNDDSLSESTSGIKNEVASNESVDREKGGGDDDDVVDVETTANEFSRLGISETFNIDESEGSGVGCSQIISGSSYPPPPPVPPPKPSMANFNSRRTVLGGSSADRIGPSRRAVAWPVVSTRTSPSGSHPSSPRSYGEGEGYNSADEHNPCYGFSYDDAENWSRPSLDNLEFARLETEEAQWLERRFEEEVRAAIFVLSRDKASGPDGFPMAFFQRFWADVEQEIMDFMEEFYSRGKLLKTLGASFISLVPKRKGELGIKDYRPISLIGSIYKILANVLARRIKRVLLNIISNEQGAFVEGRQILDGVLTSVCIR